MLHEPKAQRRDRAFGREAPATPGPMELEPDFDPLGVGPVRELVETDAADPSAAQAALGDRRDPLGRQRAASPKRPDRSTSDGARRRRAVPTV
jgi:hypothetical protein